MSYENAARQQLRRKWWLRAVGILACIVVFITVYALVLPAITMEGTPTCGLEEHTHDAECYDAEGVLICTLEEHVHDAACYAEDDTELAEPEPDAEEPAPEPEESAEVVAASVPVETVLSANGNDYAVSVSYDETAQIPAGAALQVKEILPGTDAFASYMDKTMDSIALGGGAYQLSARFFDISIVVDGQEIEPSAPVNVVVTYDKAIADVQDANVNAVHFGTEPELIAADAENVDRKTEITFDADQFSVFGITYTVDFSYENVTFSIDGESSILLSDLFSKLDMDLNAADVTEASFSDSSLVSVEKQSGDWLLTSLKPFQTNETLTLTLKDGAVAVISVTDDVAEDDAEENFIRVQKVFVGIDKTMIPSDFAVTAAGKRLSTASSDPYFESVSDDGLTWNWKLTGLGTGTYAVSEVNYDVEGFDVAVQGVGNVEVRAGGIDITGLSERINSCSNLTFQLSDTDIFVAKSTSDEIAIVSKYSLSASQRAAILERIPDLGGNLKSWSHELFYSAENLKDKEYLNMRDVMVTVDFDNLIFKFPETKVWTQCGYVYAKPVEAQNADIQITNTYTPKVANVSIMKLNEAGGPLPGATFGLFTDSECKTPLMIDGSAVTAVTGTDGKATFSNVPSNAEYYMKETAAPAGYVLDETIHHVTFEARTVDGKTVYIGLVDGAELLEISNVHVPVDLTLIKVDKDDPSIKLDGAEFTLTRSDTVDGTYSAYPASGNVFTTNSDGKITVTLEKGYYKLVETHAPDGYILTSKEIAISVIDGKIVMLESTDPSYATMGEDGVTITAVNEPGSPLPATGGMGTVAFTVSGLTLMAAAMILLSKQRKRNEA